MSMRFPFPLYILFRKCQTKLTNNGKLKISLILSNRKIQKLKLLQLSHEYILNIKVKIQIVYPI